jgi:exodeoxyribonuclease-3
MRIAPFNVNRFNGRLPVLLLCLEEARPSVVCLLELRAPDARFPIQEIEKAGYGAIWHGEKSRNGGAIIFRGREPIETRRGLPGDPDDNQSRYILCESRFFVLAWRERAQRPARIMASENQRRQHVAFRHVPFSISKRSRGILLSV